jgi:hypothetical protein
MIPTIHYHAWSQYERANRLAHAHYMRYFSGRAIPPPSTVIGHGAKSAAHWCRRPLCADANRAMKVRWEKARRKEKASAARWLGEANLAAEENPQHAESGGVLSQTGERIERSANSGSAARIRTPDDAPLVTELSSRTATQ